MGELVNYNDARIEINRLIAFGNRINSSSNTILINERMFYEWKKQVNNFFENYLPNLGYSTEFQVCCLIHSKAELERGLDVLHSCKTNLLSSLETPKLDISIGNQASIENCCSNKFDKIFISHSVKDKKTVGLLIDIIESIGVPQDKIFCSSFEGYGIKLGENFLARIKEELNSNTLVLFVLSRNFYKSKVCLCEMGATWIQTHEHIPVLIPPFDFKDIEGVIPLTQGFKINDIEKLNSFKKILIDNFQLKDLDINVWERKRNHLITNLKFDSPSVEDFNKSANYRDMQIGDAVFHTKFGIGEVLQIDPETVVRIKFKNGGVKDLLIEMANLKTT